MSTTSEFLRACRRESVTRRPVWFMRQAGRSLPEYRKLREGTTMLESCRRPEMVAEITLQPVRRLGVDAAILFSDIVVPLAAAGVDVDIQPGVGPVIAEPVRDADAVAAIRPLAADQVAHVAESVRLLTAELGDTPLIGFAGAPFTLASYLVEGGPSRSHARTKALMHGAPEVWHALCERLVQITVEFLRVQVAAGVSAVQLFDSWAGALSEADYRRYVAPHSAAVLSAVAAVAPDLPRIHFGVGTGHLLPAMAEAGATVVGADWRTPLDQASAAVGPDRAVQGNLDPALLLAPWPVLEAEVRRICAEGDGTPGHVFNLGHGVLPETDPDALARVVELVHALPPA
ncbi:uroporphyrinogen decarboxylase [Actinocatenispora rupis]|uniref:Uroporphyrinogen decarboxylase n=2 Tax=Actinocatenispora rupis TaxID=519421 RepID=A0A8J3JA48_9ACTN|nr:uroporphyrinogen decarboxylase [Actinocatenispora rupis]